MSRILYTAMNGAQRLLQEQALVTNGLANVNTVGFKQQLSMQRAVPLQGGAVHPTRVSTVTTTVGAHMAQGPLSETGGALDLAVQGDGWFAVQTPQGEAYTRAGDFSVNQDNILVTAQGYPVLSADNALIEIPESGSVHFSVDGQISALGAGDNPRDIQALGQIKLVNPAPESLVRGEDGWFRMADGQVAPMANEVRVIPGFLEKSNVSAAESMVALIDNARQFEMQMKVIDDSSTNAERANTILSLS
ncbi:MAG TPA: flagellar basal body rod protein FlgF [Paenalcaligenes sp.]|nr:flagellar basal body rod protein FlgF [Paenalcaligenes sp.]